MNLKRFIGPSVGIFMLPNELDIIAKDKHIRLKCSRKVMEPGEVLWLYSGISHTLSSNAWDLREKTLTEKGFCEVNAGLGPPQSRESCQGFCRAGIDRKSTRLNSSHGYISYAVSCLQKK